MRLLAAAALGFGLVVVSPATAAVLGAQNVALTTTPTFFELPGATFGFTFDADKAAVFDFMPYSVVTTGTAQTSAFFGQPSPFDQRGIVIDGNLFPSYAAIPTLTPIPFSIVSEDLALRFSAGNSFYYGYARLNGNGTLDFAFESTANKAIIAGAPITGALAAVPEPASWALLIVGFGAVGATLRRRRSVQNVQVTFA